MTPESIVTSLEWSKKLKEAGWSQEDLHYWIKHASSPKPFVTFRHNMLQRDSETLEICFAAPTCEEILRSLPVFIRSKNLEYALEMVKFFDGSYGLWYTKTAANRNKRSGSCHTDTSLANAAAAMWLYLKESKLLPDSN